MRWASHCEHSARLANQGVGVQGTGDSLLLQAEIPWAVLDTPKPGEDFLSIQRLFPLPVEGMKFEGM